MNKKGSSIRTEIIGPLLGLSAIGLATMSWVIFASFQTQDKMRVASESALQSVQITHDLKVELNKLNAQIARALEMVHFAKPDQFKSELSDTTKNLRQLIHRQAELAQDRIMTEQVARLKNKVENLIRESEALISAPNAQFVPTNYLLERRTKDLIQFSDELTAIADKSSIQSSKNVQAEFLRSLVWVAALMISAFVAAVLFALSRANNIISILQDLSSTMLRIRNYDFPASIDAAKRSDEIGSMARSVEAFANGLKKLTSAKEKIEHLAHHDPLTGLPNRRSFQEQILRHFRLNSSNGAPFVIFVLDLDHFKSINDTLGHPVGDTLLTRVTERILHAVDSAHFVARLGGDEFAILITEATKPRSTARLAKELIDLLSRPFLINGSVINISTSIGIACAPADGADLKEILQKADLALHRSKLHGRNTYTFYDESLNTNVQSRRSMEEDLRKVLAKNELELHYQPLISSKTGKIVALEALCRWNHPRRGMVNPAEFIPIAEETGLISQIGEWVLMTACEEAKRWPDSVRMAVNLSPVQFQKGNVAATVKTVLEKINLAPERLELEITERVFLEQTAKNVKTLENLKELGIRIALDDFGTGYSSLSYISSFPFDKVKIDRSFVSGVPENDQASAIVSAIITLGIALGVTTTAEGVETRQQREFLTQEGCDELQGYLISKPLPPARAHDFARSAPRAVA